MTMMTRVTKTFGPTRETWAVAEAKAHFSEMIEKALAEGPQVITRKGRRAVVVVSAAEWERKTRRHGSLAEFLANSPLRGSELDLGRISDRPRDVQL